MRLLLALLLTLLSTGTTLADISRFDPPDPRLEQRVTLEVNHAKLEDVLNKLTEQTGVGFKAGNSERDWKVRERKVTIHAKDIPLSTMMEEISDLLGFYISRGGKENEWTYMYWQDLKSRKLEEEMLIAEHEAAARRTMELRQAAFETAEEALRLSPEDALAKRNADPWTAYLGGTKAGRGYAKLLLHLWDGYPTERELMMRGRRVTLPLSNLPPDLIQAALDTAYGSFFGAMASQDNEDWNEMIEGAAPYQMVVMPASEFGAEAEAGQFGFGGMVMITARLPRVDIEDNPFADALFNLGGGTPISWFPLTDSKSFMGKFFGEMLLASQESGGSEEVLERVESKWEDPDFLAETLARESPTEEDPPTDPELTREVELAEVPESTAMLVRKSDPEEAGKAVAEMSKAMGIPVLMESFASSTPIGLFLRPGKQPVYRMLVAVEKAGCLWTLDKENVLRIRPDDWATKRSYEISESFLAYYKDLLKKQGEFTLDDLAEIASSLTDGQVENTLVSDPDLSFALMGLTSTIGGGRDILRVYGSLSSMQKAAIRTEAGLPFAQLTNAQWQQLGELVNNRLGGVYILDGSIRIPDVVEVEDAAPSATHLFHSNVFEITVLASGEERPRTISFTVMRMTKEGMEDMKKSTEKAPEKADTEDTEAEE